MDDNDLNKEDKLVHDSKVHNENQQQQRHNQPTQKEQGC